MPAAARLVCSLSTITCVLVLVLGDSRDVSAEPTLRNASISEAFSASASSDPPDANQLLAAMHDYAENYVSALPDFICVQVTEQFQTGKKGENWKQLDSLTSKLVFAGGQEHRTLELVNGRKPNGSHFTRRPLITNGEFAILIANIFSESSQAAFAWKGWQLLQGQRCAVFSYRIDREHSTMKLGLSDLASAIVPYEGLVFADASTGSIRRVTNEANDIPPEVRTRRIATTIDYWPVTVGKNIYLLPSDASVEIAIPTGRVRNELHFRDYQKFEAQSTITFDSNSEPVEKPLHPPDL